MVVLVTGAASGIGAAVARLAAASGAALMLTDRDAGGMAAVAAALPGAVGTVVADLADIRSPGQVIAATLARFGRIDGLVNAAGLTDRASFIDGSEAMWDRLFAVNARAPFFLMQGALADMTARGHGGAIVNILSMNAYCGTPELAIYSATKGALLTLTKNAANAHLADRVRVNGINLGWVLTPAEDRMQAVTLGKGTDWAARVAAGMPLGRLLEPDEAARLAVYLLGPASAPMTGAVIDLEQRVAGAP
jgi:NAD(P)-dependent dehydrogenase (short-subunit alcohol dehydrogenase family)